MLTKKQFLHRINFLKTYADAMDEFDQALKKFAPSDFTGFYNNKVYTELLDNLIEDMEDEYKFISWWVCDTEWGTRKDLCKIWEIGHEDDAPIAILDTAELLYDYMVSAYSKTPSKDTLNMCIRAQDNGLKFALKTIQEIIDTNTKTHNDEWETRNTLMKLIKNKIKSEYQFATGTSRDLESFDHIHIMSLLDEES